MAANFWESTHYKNSLFSKEAIDASYEHEKIGRVEKDHLYIFFADSLDPLLAFSGQ